MSWLNFGSDPKHIVDLVGSPVIRAFALRDPLDLSRQLGRSWGPSILCPLHLLQRAVVFSPGTVGSLYCSPRPHNWTWRREWKRTGEGHGWNGDGTRAETGKNGGSPFQRFSRGSACVTGRSQECPATGCNGGKDRVQIAALSGNSLRQTVHTNRASVHQAAKLAAALFRVASVTAGLAESNGSLPPGLWLTSRAGWLPRTGIRSGTLR